MQAITPQVRLFVPVTVGAATVAVVALADRIAWQAWPQLLLFLGIIALAYSVRIPDPRGGAVTPSTVLSYVGIFTFSPPTALLVFGAGRTIGYVLSRGWVPWRALFNGSLIALSVGAGSLVFGLLGGTRGFEEWSSSVVAAIAAPLAFQAANNFFYAYSVSSWRRTPLGSTWFEGIRDLFWPNLLSIPTAIVLAILYARVHHTVILAYLALLPFQWLALRLYARQRQLYAQIVDGLVVAADVNFPVTRGHARRVADLAVAVTRELRLSEAMVESVQFASLLHDIGMIGKDDLMEGSGLTPEAVESLREHVRVGAEIARELPRQEVAAFVRHHHERYDGTGYPDGLKGEEIPLGARVIAIAEAADSMAWGVYPHAAPTSPEAVLAWITQERGRAFDPDVVDAFQRVVDRGTAGFAGTSDQESASQEG